MAIHPVYIHFNHAKPLVQCERKTELSSQFLSFLVYKR
nr:MAG TPA: hypothetical protein [Microviridae sp.]